MRKSISSKERVLYTAQSVATAKDGSFLLEDIKPGKYYLLCSPPRNPSGKTALAPTFFPASVSDQDGLAQFLRY
jgi:hypothetical protein